MDQELRPFWNKIFSFNWVYGLVLILAVCIPRFIMVLNANVTGNYGSIGMIMVISAIVPFIFLSKKGRRKIGVKIPEKYPWLVYSFASGILLGSILFLLGYLLYTETISNWYIYIGRSYNIAPGLNAQDKLIYFTIFAITGMTFSPVGEELFFRGIVHSAFSKSLGEKYATIIESLSFALTHLAHFGIVYVSSAWEFLFIPSLLWVLAMFATSVVFVLCKRKTGSILGAIAAHAGFNLTMIYFIFYHL